MQVPANNCVPITFHFEDRFSLTKSIPGESFTPLSCISMTTEITAVYQQLVISEVFHTIVGIISQNSHFWYLFNLANLIHVCSNYVCLPDSSGGPLLPEGMWATGQRSVSYMTFSTQVIYWCLK